MSGEISVESEVSKGSTFTVCLPAEITDHKAVPALLAERDPNNVRFHAGLSQGAGRREG